MTCSIAKLGCSAITSCSRSALPGRRPAVMWSMADGRFSYRGCTPGSPVRWTDRDDLGCGAVRRHRCGGQSWDGSLARRSLGPAAVGHHISIPTSRRVRPQPGVVIHSDMTSVDAALDVVLRAIQRRVTLRSASGPRCSIARATGSGPCCLTSLQTHRTALNLRWRGTTFATSNSPMASPEHDAICRRQLVAEGAITKMFDTRSGRRSLNSTAGRRIRSTSFRDHRRDNPSAVVGDAALRYEWRDVIANPCGVAAEVAAVLRPRGWAGVPVGCGPRCALPLAP